MTTTPEPGRSRGRVVIAGCVVGAVAAATVGVILLTGGDDKPNAGPTAPPTPSLTSPAPTPTISTPPKPEDLAVTAAKAKFTEYVQVRDRITQGGYKNLKLYDTVAISPARTQLLLEAKRTTAIRTTGDSEVVALSVQSVKLATDPKSYDEVRLRGCLDVQAVKAFKADGSSAVTADRLPRIAFTATVQNVPAAALGDGRPGGWYLAELGYPGGGTKC